MDKEQYYSAADIRLFVKEAIQTGWVDCPDEVREEVKPDYIAHCKEEGLPVIVATEHEDGTASIYLDTSTTDNILKHGDQEDLFFRTLSFVPKLGGNHKGALHHGGFNVSGVPLERLEYVVQHIQTTLQKREAKRMAAN